jgi:predicted DNA-binding antitoxin AbrB/MazE fold protein
MGEIRAIYENGVFRPLEPVELPEGAEVELRILRIVGNEAVRTSDAIYRILDQRFESGHTDTAARHNEHQP